MTPTARSASRLISCTDSRCSSDSDSSSNSCANVEIPVNGLFSSCATPATSSPSAASFSV